MRSLTRFRTALRREGAHGGFLRSAATLASGTALSQGIMLAALPLITRLYSPHDFSALAVYVATVNILAVGACLRLDIAVPLPEADRTAANLLASALAASALSSIATAILFFAAPHHVLEALGLDRLESLLWLAPIGMWATSSCAAVQYWAIRRREFNRVSRTRLAQGLTAATTQIALGMSTGASVGLLLGHLASGCVGFFTHMTRFVRRPRSSEDRISLEGMRRAVHEHRRFPLFSTPEAVLNTLGSQAPLLIISAWVAGPEVGLLMLALRVMQSPLALVGTAISQVYLADAPKAHRDGTLHVLTARVLANFSMIGAGPIIIVGVLAPHVFGLLFGSEWSAAGDLAFMMIPWLVLQFLSSPISMTMHVTGRQGQMFAITFFGLIVRLGAIAAATRWAPSMVTESFLFSSALFYAVCLVLFSRNAGLRTRDVTFVLRRGGPVVLVACGAALALNVLLG